MHARQRVLGVAVLLMGAVLAWRWQADIGQSAGVDYGNMAVPELGQATEIMADAGAALAQTSAPPRQTAAVPTPISRPPKDAAVALDAPALGYRVSAAQLADDMARLVAADDLAPLLAEFKRRAAQGDADAAARMRDIYDECLGVHMAQMNSAHEPHFNRSAFGVTTPSADAPLRQAALQIGSARCSGIIPHGDNRARTIQLGRLHRDSVRLAADLGHPGARVRAQGYEIDPTLRPQRQRRAALVLLREGSPEALMDLSAYASEGTPFRSDSWILAACELGYPCASVPGIRYNYCATYGSFCEVESMQEFTRQSVSARDWRLIQAERDQILALLQAGDLGALLLSDEAIGGGG